MPANVGNDDDDDDDETPTSATVFCPLTMLLDLCLYRVVSERCGGRVLPFGIRQLIKDYVGPVFDNETLRQAVRLW